MLGYKLYLSQKSEKRWPISLVLYTIGNYLYKDLIIYVTEFIDSSVSLFQNFFTMSVDEAKKIASYALKIRNLIFPPTSYVSGSGARVVVDVSSRDGLVDSLLSLEDGAATTNVGTKIGGFRKIVCVSKDSNHENERVQCVTYDGNPVDWLSKEYENVASKSLVLARANDDEAILTSLCSHVKNSTCPLLIVEIDKKLIDSIKVSSEITIHESCVLNDTNVVLAISSSTLREKERRHRGGLPTVCDKTQFQELRKDLSSDTISETGKRVIDIIKRSAALYRCPKGQMLMVDTLKRLVSQKDQDDEVVYVVCFIIHST